MSREEIAHDFAEALAAEQAILATGLPELAHSRAVLLTHADGPLGELTFTSNRSSRQVPLQRAGETAAIDGYPEAPRSIDPAHLERDFAAALTTLAETRKGLDSYALVLDDSQGGAPQLTYRHRLGSASLNDSGDGLTLADGLDYQPDPARVAREFGAALPEATLRADRRGGSFRGSLI